MHPGRGDPGRHDRLRGLAGRTPCERIGPLQAAVRATRRVARARSQHETDRIRELAPDGNDLVFAADEATVLDLSRALVGAGLGIAALVPERGDTRGAVLRADRGGRTSASARGRSHEANHVDRLPLGVTQAPVAEAHLHRDRRCGAPADAVRHRDGAPEGRPLRRTARAQPPQDRPRSRPRRAHLRVALRRPTRHRFGRGRHRRERNQRRHPQDGLHAVAATQSDRGWEDARHVHLRDRSAARAPFSPALVGGTIAWGYNPLTNFTGTQLSATFIPSL